MLKQIKFNNTQLKYLAAFFMFIDHFSLLFLSYGSLVYFIGRGIGRLAAPIFFWAISEGALHTRNIKKYFLNILIFGLVVQLIYAIAMGESHSVIDLISQNKNIFLTLSLGLLGIMIIKKYPEQKILQGVSTLLLCVTGEIINVDYGWYGVAFIILFYLLKENRIKLVASLILINIIRFVLLYKTVELVPNAIQFLSLLTLPLIFMYDGKRGNGNKYFFYLFYPLHLGLLYLLKEILGF